MLRGEGRSGCVKRKAHEEPWAHDGLDEPESLEINESLEQRGWNQEVCTEYVGPVHVYSDSGNREEHSRTWVTFALSFSELPLDSDSCLPIAFRTKRRPLRV